MAQEVTVIPSSCSVIYGMNNIPTNYVLHTDKIGYKWTLGTLLNGNVIKPIKYKNKTYTVKDIVCNLKGLTENILAPINETIGRIGFIWNLNSAYRNNSTEGGSKISEHVVGLAADISCGNSNFAYSLNYDCAVKLSDFLAYNQMLLHYRNSGKDGNRSKDRLNWIHISYDPNGTIRRRLMTYLNDRAYADNLVRLE